MRVLTKTRTMNLILMISGNELIIYKETFTTENATAEWLCDAIEHKTKN